MSNKGRPPVPPRRRGASLASKPTPPSIPAPSSPPPRKSTSATSKKELSYAKSLPHKFDDIRVQNEAASKLMKRVRSAIHKVASAHMDLGQTLRKLGSTEAQRVLGQQEQYSMHSTVQGVASMFLSIKEMGDHYVHFTSNLEASLRSLDVCLSNFNDRSKQCISEAGKYISSFDKKKQEVYKVRKPCQKAITDAISKKQAHRQLIMQHKVTSSVGDNNKHRAVVGNLKQSVIKKLESSARNVEKTRLKAVETTQVYENAIDLANRFHKEFHWKLMPAFLSRLEEIEKARIVETTKVITSMTGHVATLAARVQKVGETGLNSVQQIDGDADVRGYISNRLLVMEKDRRVPTAHPFSNMMPLHPEDLESVRYYNDLPLGRVEVFENPITEVKSGGGAPGVGAGGGAAKAAVFMRTVDQVLKQEERWGKQKNKKSVVPVMVDVLLRSVHSLGGFSAEGIFRVSCDGRERQRVIEEFDAGKYGLKDVTSPHVPAGVLKAWLRDLSVPLFPPKVYDQCISFAKQYDGHLKEIQGRTPPDQPPPGVDEVLKSSALRQLLDTLPAPNVAILYKLMHFIWRLLDEGSEATRMSTNSVAIVFGPGLMRTEDPLRLLVDAAPINRFVMLLIDTMRSDKHRVAVWDALLQSKQLDKKQSGDLINSYLGGDDSSPTPSSEMKAEPVKLRPPPSDLNEAILESQENPTSPEPFVLRPPPVNAAATVTPGSASPIDSFLPKKPLIPSKKGPPPRRRTGFVPGSSGSLGTVGLVASRRKSFQVTPTAPPEKK